MELRKLFGIVSTDTHSTEALPSLPILNKIQVFAKTILYFSEKPQSRTCLKILYFSGILLQICYHLVYKNCQIEGFRTLSTGK